MNVFAPLEIGATMGLVLGGAVLALAVAFRLFRFPDLSVEGSLPLGAAVYAASVRADLAQWLAVALALFAGAAVGAATAAVHSYLRVNKFLAGILLIAVSYSLALRAMGASNIGLLGKETLLDTLSPSSAGFASMLPLLLVGSVLLGLLAFVALGTRAGTRVRAVGSNPEYAAALGLRVGAHRVVALALTNAASAFSGVLLASHQGFADVGMGQGILVLALAAMTLGEAVVPKTRLPLPAFVVVAALVGSVLYQIVLALALRLGVPAVDLKLVTAILVLVVIAVRARRGPEETANGGLS